MDVAILFDHRSAIKYRYIGGPAGERFFPNYKTENAAEEFRPR
jgi:hypothetical protein